MKRDKRTAAQLKAAVAKEWKAETAAYLKQWTAFMRRHMDNFDKAQEQKRWARTIRAR